MSAPQGRYLKRDAVKRFLPDVVRKKQQAVRGRGGLVKPEELDKLEKEGYLGPPLSGMPAQSGHGSLDGGEPESTVVAAESNDVVGELKRLAEEEERFRKEMHQVEMEEVKDEDL